MDNQRVQRVVAVWRPAPGQRGAVREILRELAGLTAREPGCLGFEVLESVDPEGAFVLDEYYADPAARDAHRESAHFRDLVLDRAVPLLEHRDVRTYRTLWRLRHD